MERLRNSWFALMGGVLLVTLSISVAFGAGPAATLDSPPGESIAEFVHGLIFTSPDDPESEPETADHEEVDEMELDGDEDGSHGECVSEVARSDEVGGPNDNHGGAVSEAAQTCPGADDDDEVVEEEEPVVEENGDEDEDDAHGKCVSEVARSDEVGGPNNNHGGAVSEAARETCPGGDSDDENGDDVDTADNDDDDDTAQGQGRARGKDIANEARKRGGKGRGGGRS